MKNSDTPAMPSKAKLNKETFTVEDYQIGDDNEYQFSGFTKREQSCITLGIPESGDQDLDALILKSERKRIAAITMRGLLSSGLSMDVGPSHVENNQILAICSKTLADALLKELAK